MWSPLRPRCLLDLRLWVYGGILFHMAAGLSSVLFAFSFHVVFLNETHSSPEYDISPRNVTTCLLEHSDARPACIPAVWDSQKLCIATSRLSFRWLCVRYSVVLWCWWGVHKLRVVIWWWARDGKTCGLQSSGRVACPQPANHHHVHEVRKVQGSDNRTLWYSISHRPHQNTPCPKYPET